MLRKNVRFFLIVVIIFTAIFPCTAFASQVDIQTEPTEISVGDTVTVTVTVSGDRIAIVQGTFNYDHTILAYISSTGGAADGKLNMIALEQGGAPSLTAVIEFKAIESGVVGFSAAIESILDYSGESKETSEASISIDILPAPVSPIEEESETEVQIPFELDGIPASNVLDTAAELYVWRSVQNLTLPSGFVDTQITYKGERVNGATDGKAESLILLYLSGINGEQAGYYIYQPEEDTLQPYVVLKSEAQSLTLLWPDASVKPPEGYIETIITYNEQKVPAWMNEGSDGRAYLVYAKNHAGENALYQYLPDEESFQKFIAQPILEENEDVGGTNYMTWLIAISVLSGLLLVMVIILLSLCKFSKRGH